MLRKIWRIGCSQCSRGKDPGEPLRNIAYNASRTLNTNLLRPHNVLQQAFRRLFLHYSFSFTVRYGLLFTLYKAVCQYFSLEGLNGYFSSCYLHVPVFPGPIPVCPGLGLCPSKSNVLLFNCAFGRVETHNAKLDMHEERFEEMDVLTGRIKLVEEAVENISGVLLLLLRLLVRSVPRSSRQCSPLSEPSMRHGFSPSLVDAIGHAFNTWKLIPPNHGLIVTFHLQQPQETKYSWRPVTWEKHLP